MWSLRSLIILGFLYPNTVITQLFRVFIYFIPTSLICYGIFGLTANYLRLTSYFIPTEYLASISKLFIFIGIIFYILFTELLITIFELKKMKRKVSITTRVENYLIALLIFIPESIVMLYVVLAYGFFPQTY